MQATRPYAKEELQSLRRANLQNLCKIHNIKGANAKTDVLIDLLTQFYASSAYLNSPAYSQYLAAVAEAEVTRRPSHLSKSSSHSQPTSTASRVHQVKSRIPSATAVTSGNAAAEGDRSTHRRAISRRTKPPSRNAPTSVRPRSVITVAPSVDGSRPASAASIATKRDPSTTGAVISTTSATTSNHRPEVDVRTELQELRKSVARLESEREDKMNQLVEAKIHQAIKQREAALEQREAWVKQREAELEDAWARLRAAVQQHCGNLPEGFALESGLQTSSKNNERDVATPVSPPEAPASATRSSARLGKRQIRSAPRNEGQQSRPSKIVRMDSNDPLPNEFVVEEEKNDLPHTPPPGDRQQQQLPPDFTLQPPSSSNASDQRSQGHNPATPTPRTPSPAHQGVTADNSMTPAVGSEINFVHGQDFFGNPPPLYDSGKKRTRTTPQLPYPIFATTPRPTEPHSPTIEYQPVIASLGGGPAGESRIVGGTRGGGRGGEGRSSVELPAMLTPGRAAPPPPPHSAVRRVDNPTPRKISKAHLDLTTITETSEDPHAHLYGHGIGHGHHRAESPADAPTPASILGPELAKARSTTPPALSPSPSIGGDNFTYTPLPRHPGPSSNTFGLAGSNRVRARSRALNSSSPAREYMDVALHGLNNPQDSPSALATPNHRTMLGTERYRDTRFGDEPLVPWGSPTVDLDAGYLNTPGGRKW